LASTIAGVHGWTISSAFFLWLWAMAAGGASATASDSRTAILNTSAAQKLTAMPESRRQSGSACTPLTWFTTGTPIEAKADHFSQESRKPGER
jgi:hypothetical protein